MATTFAFVRYKEINEMEKAINYGNGRRLDGFFITVKKADYGWDQRRKGSQRNHTTQPRKQQKDIYAKQPCINRHQWPCSSRDERTYLQALQNNMQSKSSPQQPSFNIDICQKEFEWLVRSAVGTLLNYVHHQILQEIFAEEGYQCTVKSM
ncbi:Uncharacterized protein TCM_020363 [Theobroma cacao]|uniref:RRM domain-containing protein n=1 Tax=Theobroma cacao TaxID=3641 RepID=A0A061ESR2_THECC|nr:Uncharacterized protein TCM_020363 [Theobroma cacao]